MPFEKHTILGSNMSLKMRSGYDSSRMSASGIKKVYEEMLLKELPGQNKSNQPMHAVLESCLDDDGSSGGQEAQRVRNHALIHYLASLANSNSSDDKFDFDFVESLIYNGADINSTDKNGQTIFHEVARSWNLDVASFLIDNGADLNKQDKFGRSPLHVASAVDYADMVQFLVKSGADINISTYGEDQTPIHYAAKNDGCRSLKMLLGYGADIDSRDSKNRTPLQVAAEMNRDKAAKLLIQHGAPAGVNDSLGNSALTLLIEKLPDVAVEALDQFQSINTINRKEYFFLNYLEGDRLKDPNSPSFSALEIAVQNQEFDVVLHPVMRRLIFIKWRKFGRFGALKDLLLNLIYAILWTIIAVTTPGHGTLLYIPWSTNAWRLVKAVLVCLMTVDEIRKQLTGIVRTRRRQKKWLTWRVAGLREELSYCHPRWPQEEMYLNAEIAAIEDTPLISSGDAWKYFDWLSLILILATIASHSIYVGLNTEICRKVYMRIITVLLMVLWFRILKYARPFEGAGPFVVIFGHIVKDILTWGLLLSVIAIPFGCAFWITFGKFSARPVASYSYIPSLLYNMFSMMVVDDHDFEALEEADATMARLLCGSYIGIISVIHLNLLIALLSDTFSRVYSNAVANAIMQRAKTILLIEQSLSSKTKRAYHDFIKNNCSPETVDLDRDMTMNSERDAQKASGILQQQVKEVHVLLNERLGKQYGKGQNSDFDLIRESIVEMAEQRERQQNEMGMMKQRLDQIKLVLFRMSHSLKIDVDDIDFSFSDEGDEVEEERVMNSSRRKSFLNDDDHRNSDSDENYHDSPRKLSLEQPPIGKGILNEAYERDEARRTKTANAISRTGSQIHRDGRAHRRECVENLTKTHDRSPKVSLQGSKISRRGSSVQRELPRNRDENFNERPNVRSQSVRDQRDSFRKSRYKQREASRLQLGSPNHSSEALATRRKTDKDFSEESSGSDERCYKDGQSEKETDTPRRNVRQRGHGKQLSRTPSRDSKYLSTTESRQKRASRRGSDYERNNPDNGKPSQGSSRKPLPNLEDRRSNNDVHSDNDLRERNRQRLSKERRYYEDWDNRSIKSVAF